MNLPAVYSPEEAVAKNKEARAVLKLLWLGLHPDPPKDQDGKPLPLELIRAGIKQRCANDFVFWANHFAAAHDEHAPPKERIKSVVLWPYQVEIATTMIEEIWRCAEGFDEEWNAYGDKARQMAWTYTVLLVLQWFWQFHGISTVITSKTEDDVDRKGDMDTPFEKLRWQIEQMYNQAPWLFPEKFSITDQEHYKKKLIAIADGGARLVGAAARGPALRQGRALIWFGDEFPHTENDFELWDAAAGTVKVRIVGGTPNKERGRNCKAYKIRFNKDKENAHIFTCEWWKHPERARGLYRKSDGTLSSPWFDKQTAKKSRQTIATEYLMDWDVALGKPPLYAFREECNKIGLEPDPYGGPIFCSWDPGKNFGVKWGQFDRLGRLRDFRELFLTPDDCVEGKTLLDTIAEKVKWINEHVYRDYEVVHVGDPYGSRTQIASQEKSEYELLMSKHKIRVQSAYMYAISSDERKKLRHEYLNDLMGTDVIDDSGKITPKYLIDNRACPLTYEAIKVGYRWKILDDGTVTDEIKKSHPDGEMIDTIGMIAVKVLHKKKGSNTTGGESTGRPKVKRQQTTWRKTGARSQLYG